MKGGRGESTSVLNVSATLTPRFGKRVLLVNVFLLTEKTDEAC